jgi:hypothetical protein
MYEAIGKHLVSLEIAHRLKAAGVSQLSTFSWMEWQGEWDVYYRIDRRFSNMTQDEWRQCVDTSYAAFLVSELIELLGDNFGVLERFHGGEFGAYIPNNCGVNGVANKPVDALALLLEQVIELRE